MANVTNISVLDSAATTATVSTLDAFRSNIGTSALSVVNATASLFNATVTGTLSVTNISTSNIAQETGGNLAIIASNITASIPTGTAVIGKVGIDQTSPGNTNAVGNSTASLFNATIIGTAILGAGASQIGSVTATISGTITAAIAPTTSGGLLTSTLVSTASINTTIVKGSAGQIYGYSVFNNGTTVAYLKLYNQTTITGGISTGIVKRIYVPATGGVERDIASGIQCTTGICFAITTGIADTDTTSVSGNQFLINIDYK